MPPRKLAALQKVREGRLQFSTDRRYVCQESGDGLLNGTTEFVDWEKDACAFRWQLPESTLYTVCLAPDHETLIVGRNDGSINLVEIPSMKTTRSIPVAPGEVFTYRDISQDGRIYAAATLKKVYLWDSR